MDIRFLLMILILCLNPLTGCQRIRAYNPECSKPVLGQYLIDRFLSSKCPLRFSPTACSGQLSIFQRLLAEWWCFSIFFTMGILNLQDGNSEPKFDSRHCKVSFFSTVPLHPPGCKAVVRDEFAPQSLNKLLRTGDGIGGVPFLGCSRKLLHAQ